MAIQWAIIGADDTALEFAKNIRNSANGRIRAVASADRYESFCFAKRTAAAFYYSDFKNILHDETIRSVYITQIDPSNMDLVLNLLKSGKSVVYDRVFMNTKQMEDLMMYSCIYSGNPALISRMD